MITLSFTNSLNNRILSEMITNVCVTMVVYVCFDLTTFEKEDS